MSKPYFKHVPNFDYVSLLENAKISDYIEVKNLFKRVKLREDIFGNITYFERYSLIGDERADNVAYKFYGDESLDWVILISNNILNLQTEWPMPQITFEKVMLEKYGSYENFYSGIHHHETIDIKNSLGISVLQKGLYHSKDQYFRVVNTSKIVNIFSPVDYEDGRVVFVGLDNPFYTLKEDDEVVISNIKEPIYEGKIKVESLIKIDDSNVVQTRDLLPAAGANPGDSYVTLTDNNLWVWGNNNWNNMGVIRYEKGESRTPGFTYRVDTVPEIKNPSLNGSEMADKILPSNYLRYYDPKMKKNVEIPSTDYIIPITNYQYEIAKEELKRNIYILKPKYLNIIFNDIDDLMTYKKGGTQYVSPTLKRGDNIRLYT